MGNALQGARYNTEPHAAESSTTRRCWLTLTLTRAPIGRHCSNYTRTQTNECRTCNAVQSSTIQYNTARHSTNQSTPVHPSTEATYARVAGPRTTGEPAKPIRLSGNKECGNHSQIAKQPNSQTAGRAFRFTLWPVLLCPSWPVHPPQLIQSQPSVCICCTHCTTSSCLRP